MDRNQTAAPARSPTRNKSGRPRKIRPIEIVGLLVAAIGSIAAVMVVPDVRCFLLHDCPLPASQVSVLTAEPICLGPVGGDGGNTFRDSGAPSNHLQIQSNVEIDLVQYGDNARHGGQGGNSNSPIVLKSNEKVTEIHGRYGERVDKLVIVTSAGNSYTYGGDGGGTDYKLTIPTGKTMVGFCGRANQKLDAIGVLYR